MYLIKKTNKKTKKTI